MLYNCHKCHYPPSIVWCLAQKFEGAIVVIGDKFEYRESPYVKVSFV